MNKARALSVGFLIAVISVVAVVAIVASVSSGRQAERFAQSLIFSRGVLINDILILLVICDHGSYECFDICYNAVAVFFRQFNERFKDGLFHGAQVVLCHELVKGGFIGRGEHLAGAISKPVRACAGHSADSSYM